MQGIPKQVNAAGQHSNVSHTLTTAPHDFKGGLNQAGSHAYNPRTAGGPSTLATGGIGDSSATQKLPSDALLTPSGAPGSRSYSTSQLPA